MARRPARESWTLAARPSWTLAIRITVTLLLSIIIPLVIGLVQDKTGNSLLSAFEQFMLGALVFLSVTLTGLSYEINEMVRLRQEEYEMWEVRYTFDTTLSNIRSAFINILNQCSLDENLYAQYFQRVLFQISDHMSRASTKQELRIDELTFGTTDILLAIIEHRASDTLKLVHSLDARPNNFDFSTWARSYYRELTRLAASNTISINRLFIFGDKTDLESPLAQKLLAFHASNPGYNFRAIARTDWSAIVRGHSIPEAHSEFGVWGDLLVYLAIRSSPVHMEGTYSSLPHEINRLREVFDAGWRLGITPTLQVSDPVTVDDLFTS